MRRSPLCELYVDLASKLHVEHGDKLARGAKRTLDPQRNVGDHMRLDLKLAIAEQFEENRLGQFNVGRSKAYDRALVEVATEGRECRFPRRLAPSGKSA